MRPEKKFAGSLWISFTELSCVRPSDAQGKATSGPFGRVRFHRINVVALQANQLRPASSVGHRHQPLLASSTSAYIHEYAPISVHVELASNNASCLLPACAPAQSSGLNGIRLDYRVKRYPVRQATMDEPYPLPMLKTYHLIRSDNLLTGDICRKPFKFSSAS
jgi:hypothetical protein